MKCERCKRLYDGGCPYNMPIDNCKFFEEIE